MKIEHNTYNGKNYLRKAKKKSMITKSIKQNTKN